MMIKDMPPKEMKKKMGKKKKMDTDKKVAMAQEKMHKMQMKSC